MRPGLKYSFNLVQLDTGSSHSVRRLGVRFNLRLRFPPCVGTQPETYPKQEPAPRWFGTQPGTIPSRNLGGKTNNFCMGARRPWFLAGDPPLEFFSVPRWGGFSAKVFGSYLAGVASTPRFSVPTEYVCSWRFLEFSVPGPTASLPATNPTLWNSAFFCNRIQVTKNAYENITISFTTPLCRAQSTQSLGPQQLRGQCQ